MKLVLIALGAAACHGASVVRPDDDESWAGTLTMTGFANNVPLNITIQAGVASFAWVYDVDGNGTKCAPDTETGLKWSDDGTTVKAMGTGTDPSYYSFIGTHSSPTEVSGQFEWDGKTQGTWTATKGAPLKPSTCVGDSWAGTLTMPGFAFNVPLNITIQAGVASFAWVYDVDGAGTKCAPDTETGLKWSDDGTTVNATGTGTDPSYYSFIGTHSSPTEVSGQIVWDGKTQGTWTATKGGQMKPSNCGGAASSGPNIWPLPAQYTNANTTVTVTVPSDPTSFFATPTQSDFLNQAFARYASLTFPHIVEAGKGLGDGISGLDVTAASLADDYPQLGDDESYTLTVPVSGRATLKAKTVFGALRGLETFSQLVVFDFESGTFTIPQAPWSITDSPRFPHRGLMIDTARHFQTLASIRTMIDSLPYAKLNVLHWHMSDTQSYPFQSKTYPKLWDGAYSSYERYEQEDIRAIVDYAKARGVRVIVEFDMPGHAGSWCTGYPEICPSTSCTQPLNVANNQTFDVITSVLKECTGGVASAPGNPSPGIFKDNFIHLGGDEVDTSCWTSTPSVKSWLDARGLDGDGGYAYFVNRVANIAIEQGHRPVQWSEVFDHFKGNLSKQTIVHIWKSVTNVTEVVALGYQVLVNVGYDKLSWYLDNLNVMWDAVYMNEPCAGVPDNLCPLVLGGHGEMWGETVDPSDIQQTVWPRLAAISERLWSPRDQTQNSAAAHTRIQSFRCLLNRRGIAAAPVNNADARSSPPGPGSCLKQ